MRVVWAVLLCVFSCSAMNPLETRLDHQMRSWQKRLGLDDWDLSVRVVRQNAIDSNAWGTAEWNPDAKTAVISVLDPRDYNLKGGDLRLDMECTIVHELVHIQTSPLSAPNDHVREEVVNRIMTALMGRSCPN
ncbi:MAG TPA: hypothetical protein VN736_26985 [Candidatus Limnocylindrales bacterium]|nr:hypothetical protein [Candidatus Limnocylindrales bacterium]